MAVEKVLLKASTQAAQGYPQVYPDFDPIDIPEMHICPQGYPLKNLKGQ